MDNEKLSLAKSVREIIGVEGGVVWKYWNEFSKAIPESDLPPNSTGSYLELIF